MRTLKITAVLLVNFCLLSVSQISGQDANRNDSQQLKHYNPYAATFDSKPVESMSSKCLVFEPKDFSCNCLTDFWTVSAEGTIQLWSLNNGTITGGTDVLSGASQGLAYCGDPNDLTFYSGNNYNGILYYESITGWLEIPIQTWLNNNGGYLDDQYYQGIGNGNPFCRILYYLEDDEVTMIDSLSDMLYTVADIAVDSLGQAWTFVGGSNASGIYVYDKSGLVKTYDLFFNSYNAYGLTFINNTLYIGFGPANPVYQGALVPVNLDDNTASLGDPIDFPYSFYDLAECNCVESTGIGSKAIEASSLNIFPNPAANSFTINSRHHIERIHLVDITGKVLVDEQVSCAYHTLNVSKLKDGIYFLEVYMLNSVVRKKLIIEH